MASHPRLLSVCAGIGGIDLALDLAFGARTVCYLEREARAAARLVERMGKEALDPAPVWDDLKTFDGKRWRGAVDIVAGGIPCQPFSVAGKQRRSKDERDLVDEFARVVGEVDPRFVFVEEVADFIVPDGIGRLLGALSTLGFDAEWQTVSAREMGAPHKRERAFIFGWRVPDPHSDSLWQEQGRVESEWAREAFSPDPGEGMADASSLGCKLSRGITGGSRAGISEPDRCNAELVDSVGTRCENRQDPSAGGCDESPNRSGGPKPERGSGALRSLWPPQQYDTHGWSGVAAALDPAVCGVADGYATRMDERSAIAELGNGVVPLAVAYAARTLAARAGMRI